MQHECVACIVCACRENTAGLRDQQVCIYKRADLFMNLVVESRVCLGCACASGKCLGPSTTAKFLRMQSGKCDLYSSENKLLHFGLPKCGAS